MMTPAIPCTAPTLTGHLNWSWLHAAIEQARGRPLLLAPAELPSDRSSLWIVMSDIDLIIYPNAVYQADRLRAIAHQGAHILLGHRAEAGDATSSLFPHLVPDFTASTLTISRFSEADELAADNFASRIVACTGLSEARRD